MKHLSIKEKAKAYDELIEKLRDFYRDYDTISHLIDVKEELANIIPELKESEDEKIRKRIIHALHGDVLEMSEIKEAVAWLEKQGNKDKLIKELGEYKVKYTQEVLEKHINSMGNKDDERLRKTTIAFLKDFADKGYENAVECIDWLEKQGIIDINPSEFDLRLNKLLKQFETLPKEELANSLSFYLNVVQNDGTYKQKLSGKVKPKFKVGDWITDGEKVWKIGYIEDDTYIEHCDSISAGGFIESIDKHYHLWSIKDAKDGDVLAESKGDVVLIFRGIGNEKWNDVIDYHCYYNCDLEEFVVQEELGFWGHVNDTELKPATKEQHDILFAIMHEAGYEWDAEKKELNKIEQKPAEDSCKNSDDITTEEKDRTEYKKGFECGKQRVLKYPEDFGLCKKIARKPTDNDMKEALRTEYGKGRADVIAEMQVAWSEDDESILQGIWDEILVNKHHAKEYEWKTYDKFLDWLNSLKTRCAWKPSNEQMKALANTLSLAKNCGEESAFDLRTLYEQLKKL